MSESDNIRARVASILDGASVSFSARHLGQTKRDNRECDEWRVSFAYPGKPVEEFAYFTGLGLRAEPTSAARIQARGQFPGLSENDIKRKTSYGRRYAAFLETLRKPKSPHPADVLHSIFLDSSASEQSFRDWCADYGYSDDSIKALDTYRACQENGYRLRRLFKSETIAALSESLQDY